jgi:deazaflavin-dependent oxidoreductase (nitroreductase family)
MTTSIEPHSAQNGPTRGHTIPRPLARIIPPLAGSRWFPLYGILGHVGRKSGTAYRATVVARDTADGFVIPLPWGESTQWKHNLFAAGRGTLRVRGRDWTIRDPEVIDLETARPAMGPLFRRASKAFGIRHFVRVSREPAPPAS